MTTPLEAGRFGSGHAVQRIEDAALLAGLGKFTDNVAAPGQVFIAFLRSPYAHARIGAVDLAAAKAMPGVLAVFTGAQLVAEGVQPIPTTPGFKRADGRTTVSPPRHPLAHEFVRFVGEAVAAVVAESKDAARDAAEAIALEPLNRFETDFINTCEQGLKMIKAVGSPALKLHLDTFHMNIEEKFSADAIRKAGKHLAHFHACGSGTSINTILS